MERKTENAAPSKFLEEYLDVIKEIQKLSEKMKKEEEQPHSKIEVSTDNVLAGAALGAGVTHTLRQVLRNPENAKTPGNENVEEDLAGGLYNFAVRMSYTLRQKYRESWQSSFDTYSKTNVRRAFDLGLIVAVAKNVYDVPDGGALGIYRTDVPRINPSNPSPERNPMLGRFQNTQKNSPALVFSQPMHSFQSDKSSRILSFKADSTASEHENRYGDIKTTSIAVIDKELSNIHGPFQWGLTLASQGDKKLNLSTDKIQVIMNNANLNHSANKFIRIASSNGETSLINREQTQNTSSNNVPALKPVTSALINPASLANVPALKSVTSASIQNTSSNNVFQACCMNISQKFGIGSEEATIVTKGVFWKAWGTLKIPKIYMIITTFFFTCCEERFRYEGINHFKGLSIPSAQYEEVEDFVEKNTKHDPVLMYNIVAYAYMMYGLLHFTIKSIGASADDIDKDNLLEKILKKIEQIDKKIDKIDEENKKHSTEQHNETQNLIVDLWDDAGISKKVTDIGEEINKYKTHMKDLQNIIGNLTKTDDKSREQNLNKLQEIETKVIHMQKDLTKINVDLNTRQPEIQRSITRMETDLGGLKTDFRTDESRKQNLNKLQEIETKLQDMQRDLTRMNADLNRGQPEIQKSITKMKIDLEGLRTDFRTDQARKHNSNNLQGASPLPIQEQPTESHVVSGQSPETNKKERQTYLEAARRAAAHEKQKLTEYLTVLTFYYK